MKRLAAVGMCLCMCLGMCLAMTADTATSAPPKFTLAWSEYPSWSTFGVAHEIGLINGKAGQQGSLEKKYNVDIVLKLVDYDTCLTMYGSSNCDAVCITNMDALNPSISRPSVAILPTSRSHGADALIVTGNINSVQELKDKKIYGLSKSVSEYMFARNLEEMGEDPEDYDFTNMDPGAAAIAMQQNQKSIQAIVVWNPFLLQTLNQRKDAKVLFDSTTIPGEIVDMVVFAQASLDREGGERAAQCIIEAFYAISQRMAASKTRNDTLIALGEKFSNLTVKHMRQVVRQTQFYGNAKDGIALFTGKDLKTTMAKVVKFCVSHEITPSGKSVSVGYGSKSDAPDARMRFDPTYMQAISPANSGAPSSP